jgi:hypothetical protein
MKPVIVILFGLLLLFSCKANQPVITETIVVDGLIKDCPDVLIDNQMPIPGESKRTSRYYIYKGLRKEIKDFDSAWVSKHCKVKTIVAQ